MINITLRGVQENDLQVFFEHQQDQDANYMAAFTSQDPSDQELFSKYWRKILMDENIIKQTIIYEDKVVGNILCFEQFGEREVSYWIGRKYWGKRIATHALRKFLSYVSIRPLYARTAKDNIGSIKVLQRCGFTIIDENIGFSNARGEDVEEFILILNKKIHLEQL